MKSNINNKTTDNDMTDDLATNDDSMNKKVRVDMSDMRIIAAMVVGKGKLSSKELAEQLHIPQSTVVHRMTKILKNGLVTTHVEPDFKKLGLKKGFLHIYIDDGKLDEMAAIVANMAGVLSTSVHLGNSDVVAEFVYENSKQLAEIYARIKDMDNTERVLWSEEISVVYGDGESIMTALGKNWSGISNKHPAVVDEK